MWQATSIECGVFTMKRSQIDWNRHVPLGMDGKKRRNQMTTLLGFGMGCSLVFVIRYCNARSYLWAHMNGKYQRIPTRMMLEFSELIHGVFLPLAVIAFGFAVMAVLFYLYHYQGCRSIYTMRRLPNKWELWRRCLTMPVVFLILSGLSTLLLTAVYYLIWRYCTPLDALPL